MAQGPGETLPEWHSLTLCMLLGNCVTYTTQQTTECILHFAELTALRCRVS